MVWLGQMELMPFLRRGNQEEDTSLEVNRFSLKHLCCTVSIHHIQTCAWYIAGDYLVSIPMKKGRIKDWEIFKERYPERTGIGPYDGRKC